MDEIERAQTAADSAIDAHEVAGVKYADLVAEEMRLEAERPRHKRDAIARIMATENPLTLKAHSASSAEAVVETDPLYFQHLVKQSQTVREKNLAHTSLTSARLRAELFIALIKAEAGVA